MATDLVAAFTQNELRRLETIDAVGFIASLIRSNGATGRALDDFERVNPDGRRRLVARGAIPPGTTSDPAFAAPLVHGSPLTDLVVEPARAASVMSRMSTVQVPFGVPIPVARGGPATAAFVGENIPTPVAQQVFGTATVQPAKTGEIVVQTAELVKVETMAGARAILNELADNVATGVDKLFLGTTAPVPNVAPGGILYGVTPIVPSGTTAAACAVDALNVVAQFLTLVPDPSRAVFCCPPTTAILLRQSFPQEPITVAGGSFLGLPAIVSSSVGNKIAAVDCGRLLVADDGLELDVSNYASTQMNSTPDAPPVAGTVVTSFWQANLVGIKAIRFVSWTWATAAPQATYCGPTAYVPGT